MYIHINIQSPSNRKLAYIAERRKSQEGNLPYSESSKSQQSTTAIDININESAKSNLRSPRPYNPNLPPIVKHDNYNLHIDDDGPSIYLTKKRDLSPTMKLMTKVQALFGRQRRHGKNSELMIESNSSHSNGKNSHNNACGGGGDGNLKSLKSLYKTGSDFSYMDSISNVGNNPYATCTDVTDPKAKVFDADMKSLKSLYRIDQHTAIEKEGKIIGGSNPYATCSDVTDPKMRAFDNDMKSLKSIYLTDPRVAVGGVDDKIVSGKNPYASVNLEHQQEEAEPDTSILAKLGFSAHRTSSPKHNKHPPNTTDNNTDNNTLFQLNDFDATILKSLKSVYVNANGSYTDDVEYDNPINKAHNRIRGQLAKYMLDLDDSHDNSNGRNSNNDSSEDKHVSSLSAFTKSLVRAATTPSPKKGKGSGHNSDPIKLEGESSHVTKPLKRDKNNKIDWDSYLDEIINIPEQDNNEQEIEIRINILRKKLYTLETKLQLLSTTESRPISGKIKEKGQNSDLSRNSLSKFKYNDIIYKQNSLRISPGMVHNNKHISTNFNKNNSNNNNSSPLNTGRLSYTNTTPSIDAILE